MLSPTGPGLGTRRGGTVHPPQYCWQRAEEDRVAHRTYSRLVVRRESSPARFLQRLPSIRLYLETSVFSWRGAGELYAVVGGDWATAESE